MNSAEATAALMNGDRAAHDAFHRRIEINELKTRDGFGQLTIQEKQRLARLERAEANYLAGAE